MEIRDAQSHHAAQVNEFGQLLTEATTSPEDRHINIEHEKVWSMTFGATDPAGASDFFFYMKNTDTINYIITDFRGASTVAGYVEIMGVTGTPSYISAVTVPAINRTVGSSNSPGVTCNTDSDITGITSTGVIFRMDVATVDQLNHLRTTAGIILPPGQSIALRWSAATGILNGTVSIAALV